MFKLGDKVYLIDSKVRHGTKIELVSRTFNAYTDASYKRASVVDINNHITVVQTWAIFITRSQACKFAIIHLIKLQYPFVLINTEKDIPEQYSWLEENYPELILKCMNCIVNL